MKAKELIERLKEFNENANVVDQYGNRVVSVRIQSWEIKGKSVNQVEIEIDEWGEDDE